MRTVDTTQKDRVPTEEEVRRADHRLIIKVFGIALIVGTLAIFLLY